MPEHQDDNSAVSEQQSYSNQEDQLTLRALVSTREAGVIIGKGGKNVAELREETGVKAGVSKVIQGVHDRVLTVSGTPEGVAMAYSLIARTVIDNPTAGATMDGITANNAPSVPQDAINSSTAINSVATLRLLISHNLMGTVIGRQGAKIKQIQDNSGVRMTASKTLLPQSTERVVEVRGTVEALLQAISEIGACLIEDKDRAYGTILYNPTKVSTVSDRRASFTRTGNGADFNQTDLSSSLSSSSRRTSFQPPQPQQPPSNADVRTQQISIPSDMVGCIIGKGGSKISEIRQLSGSHISIAKTPHDESGERMFTIQGTMESNERALYLLYGQLESEKERRLRGVLQQQQQQQQQQQDNVLLEEE
ncbi:cytoplasmic protein [Parasitella parasitica]|nr:cytoplasmic protein [Parasitella parasitica]